MSAAWSWLQKLVPTIPDCNYKIQCKRAYWNTTGHLLQLFLWSTVTFFAVHLNPWCWPNMKTTWSHQKICSCSPQFTSTSPIWKPLCTLLPPPRCPKSNSPGAINLADQQWTSGNPTGHACNAIPTAESILVLLLKAKFTEEVNLPGTLVRGGLLHNDRHCSEAVCRCSETGSLSSWVFGLPLSAWAIVSIRRFCLLHTHNQTQSRRHSDCHQVPARVSAVKHSAVVGTQPQILHMPWRAGWLFASRQLHCGHLQKQIRFWVQKVTRQSGSRSST